MLERADFALRGIRWQGIFGAVGWLSLHAFVRGYGDHRRGVPLPRAMRRRRSSSRTQRRTTFASSPPTKRASSV